MDLYYRNSKNEIISFVKHPYIMKAVSSLFDYEWDYTSKGTVNPRIVKFDNKMKECEMELTIHGATESEFLNNLEHFVNVTDYDVIHLQKGRIYYNESYLECYIISNTKKEKYLKTKKTVISIKIVCERKVWIHEKEFLYTENEKNTSGGLNYPFDYPHDYGIGKLASYINNNNYAPSDFRIQIFGNVNNPAISVGTHTYKLNLSLITGEYAVIDSKLKKVWKNDLNSEITNEFNTRDRDFYIFEKIPIGNSIVEWDGNFRFTIMLYIERSEPLWT